MSDIVFLVHIESIAVKGFHVDGVAHGLEIANSHIQAPMASTVLELVRLVGAAVCYDSREVITIPEGEHLSGVGFILHDH